ncbi:leucyl aminopeptidase [Deinobacterium chartae]|uniref:Probable cytosol aminopeptidase n=1 Tax=Deinobacterium chartae TaxID=521158 RepID=A0A841I6V3_9DEIO|nr:leucyl aminopeptidase family protein [Deinobacterium chartae]MBB6100140.1 leucyl aminopeptidase [Deinobacterium chartae]
MRLHNDARSSADLHLLLAQAGQLLHTPDLGPEFAALAARLSQGLEGERTATLRWTDGDYLLAAAPENAEAARALGVRLTRAAQGLEARSAQVSGLTGELAAELALGAKLAAYRFTRFKDDGKPTLEALSVTGLDEALLKRVEAIAEGVALARDLVNLPFNALNALDLTAVAQDLAQQHGLELTVWDRAECERRGLGLFLAVAQGSPVEPQFIQLRYRPAQPKRTVALVGKGVMFDTGGYSLKTSAGMVTMKCDMGGAAAVLGAVKALALLAPDVEVRAYVAATDNAVSGTAMRPGDIYTAVNGKTVEITNTDAEGRLTLGDALAVASAENPDLIVDLATLTGAKITALGDDIAALFCNDSALETEIRSAAARAGERVWPLPLEKRYLKGYQKGVADLKNSDLSPAGGSIKAALFLQEFVSGAWAHLDIAGNALSDQEHDLGPAGGTGFGVMTLVELVAPRG